MLIGFRYKNFKSFQGEQSFSLVASTDKEFALNNTLLISDRNLRLVRSGVVFGANGSGKTNLISALNCMRAIVIGSATKDGSTLKSNIHPFLLDWSSKESPTEFEVHFIHLNIRYQYGFSATRKKIVSEYLRAYPKSHPQLVFERDARNEETTWSFGPRFKGEKHTLKEVTRPDALYLSIGANLNNPTLMLVHSWFRRHMSVMLGGSRIEATARRMQRDDGLRSAICSLLQFADLGIESVDVEEIPAEKIDLPNDMPAELKGVIQRYGSPVTAIHTWHRNPAGGDSVKFEFSNESAGTRQFFGYLGPFLTALKYGRTLVVDELDTSLHPLLVRKLIGLFHDPALNARGAQLLFSTHDTTLLDQSLFRRDQIWFVERDEKSASHIYPLLEFAPRKGEALQRGYLAGRYGAIPFFETPSNLAAWLASNGGEIDSQGEESETPPR